MIDAIIKNLEKGLKLLENIDNFQYNDVTVRPYNSSIGMHMRHICDIYKCIFDGLGSGKIDFTQRDRSQIIENEISFGIACFDEIISLFKKIDYDFNQTVEVTDNLGLGLVTQKYTLGSVFIQAHGHAVHHYATLGYVIYNLGIELPDNDFGYNPTTPRN